LPDDRFPSTTGEFEADFAQSLVRWQQLANVAILASRPIAGCSLAVAVAGGLTDRKRPFSMLRLTGVQIGVLRRVVALESVVPLVLVAVLAIGMGFLAAHLFLRSQLHYSLAPPGIGYYLAVVAGLGASLAIVASTLPLL
jgi:predicted lysophospholipase L1 biosynthesis ABC-type transport system permease subunit